MKNKIKNIFLFLFIATMIANTLLACNYAEAGMFSKALPYIVIQLMACVVIAIIANYNSKKAKIAKAKARARAKAKELKKSMEEIEAQRLEDEAQRLEEARLSCIRTASTNYCFESAESYYKRLDEYEERARYLISQGLEALI